MQSTDTVPFSTHAQYQPPLPMTKEEPVVIPKQEIRMRRPQSLDFGGSHPTGVRVASAPGNIPTPIPKARIVTNQPSKTRASSGHEEKGEDDPTYCAFGRDPNAQSVVLLDTNKHRVVFRRNEVDHEDEVVPQSPPACRILDRKQSQTDKSGEMQFLL